MHGGFGIGIDAQPRGVGAHQAAARQQHPPQHGIPSQQRLLFHRPTAAIDADDAALARDRGAAGGNDAAGGDRRPAQDTARDAAQHAAITDLEHRQVGAAQQQDAVVHCSQVLLFLPRGAPKQAAGLCVQRQDRVAIAGQRNHPPLRHDEWIDGPVRPAQGGDTDGLALQIQVGRLRCRPADQAIVTVRPPRRTAGSLQRGDYARVGRQQHGPVGDRRRAAALGGHLQRMGLLPREGGPAAHRHQPHRGFPKQSPLGGIQAHGVITVPQPGQYVETPLMERGGREILRLPQRLRLAFAAADLPGHVRPARFHGQGDQRRAFALGTLLAVGETIRRPPQPPELAHRVHAPIAHGQSVAAQIAGQGELSSAASGLGIFAGTIQGQAGDPPQFIPRCQRCGDDLRLAAAEHHAADGHRVDQRREIEFQRRLTGNGLSDADAAGAESGRRGRIRRSRRLAGSQ
ncbi:MAG: hypothetical protein ABR915_24060 [Thermoguttaceae bacterium]